MKITLRSVKELSEEMRAAPRVENENRRIARDEALQKLLPAMQAMRANGYDVEQIASTMEQGGLKVSARTISQMLRTPRPQKSAA